MIRKILCGILVAASMTGCMGHNALTQKAVKFNLKTAESRWGREGLFVGMWIVPVYPLFSILDLLVFNSIEFWTGENAISGQSPLLELPMDQVRAMGFYEVEKAQIERLTANKAKLHLDFTNGDAASFDVLRNGTDYTISYRGVEFYRGTLTL